MTLVRPTYLYLFHLILLSPGGVSAYLRNSSFQMRPAKATDTSILAGLDSGPRRQRSGPVGQLGRALAMSLGSSRIKATHPRIMSPFESESYEGLLLALVPGKGCGKLLSKQTEQTKASWRDLWRSCPQLVAKQLSLAASLGFRMKGLRMLRSSLSLRWASKT